MFSAVLIQPDEKVLQILQYIEYYLWIMYIMFGGFLFLWHIFYISFLHKYDYHQSLCHASSEFGYEHVATVQSQLFWIERTAFILSHSIYQNRITSKASIKLPQGQRKWYGSVGVFSSK